MYKLNIDKAETFEANIQIEGANSTTAICRLIIETPTINVMCNGTISSGKCSGQIPKLKNFIAESFKGNIRLEVIVEDTFFTPWKDQYETTISKKVTAEVIQPTNSNSKPTIKIKEISPKRTILENISTQLQAHNITMQNAKKNAAVIKRINTNTQHQFGLNSKESFGYILEVLRKPDNSKS